MKCNYNNLKQKIIISNGKTVAVIKKKYKKIYYYPLKSTPLFIILQKEKILEIIKNNQPTKIGLNIIEFEFIDKKSNKLKIFFDKETLEFKGWQTRDSYSNDVHFIISNLKTNNQITNEFFKIPKEEELGLNNEYIREHFYTSVFTLADFRAVKTMSDLYHFQGKNKYLFMTYNQTIMKKMGKIAANENNRTVNDVLVDYYKYLLMLFSKKSRYTSNINTQMHVMGYFKKQLKHPNIYI